MKASLVRWIVGLILPLALSTVVVQIVQAGDFSKQAEIRVQGGPLYDGSLTFTYQVKDGIDVEIGVSVKRGSTREQVAERIRDSLDNRIGANVEVTWNGRREVTVTKLRGAPRFALTWAGGGTGVRLDVDYD